MADRNVRRLAVFCTLVLLGGAAAGARANAPWGERPLSFETNRGQTAAPVRFLARGPGYGVFLTPSEAVVTPRGGSPLRLRWIGAGAAARITAEGELAGRSHHLVGNDPAEWRTGIASYARVRYRGIYPGIDLVFYGDPRQLEHDFIVAPGADPRAIRLGVSGGGASRPAIDAAGDLLLGTERGMRLRKPSAYQEIDGVRRAVAARWRLRGKAAGFTVGAYDRARPLVIDPVLVTSTYLGGGALDEARAVAVDPQGNSYVAGQTFSEDFPLHGGMPHPATVAEAFVAKLAPSGSLVWSTFLGGAFSVDQANAVAVDAAGNAYVTGRTDSIDFPLVHPLPEKFLGGGGEVFVSKLAADGASLVYSTRLGGFQDSEEGLGIALDRAGSAWVVGQTHSPDFPQVRAVQEFNGGDGFVAKLSPSGSSLLFCTPLGGFSGDAATGVAVDAFGNAWVTGWTQSSGGFPVRHALQPVYGGGETDAFVAKFGPAGALFWSTYLGGRESDAAAGIAVDKAGRGVVTGKTASSNFPVLAAVQPVRRGLADAFLTRFKPGGGLVSSTFLGGVSEDGGRAVTLGAAGGIYVTGGTTSADFPVATPLRVCPSAVPGQCQSAEAFVTRYDAKASRIVFSTFLGGRGEETGQGIAKDSAQGLWVVGGTASADFPTARAFQPSLAGGTDAFVLRLDF
jgi:hypothetical protein